VLKEKDIFIKKCNYMFMDFMLNFLNIVDGIIF